MFKFWYRRSRREYLTYKERARQLVKQKLLHFNSFYQFNIGRIAIKNHKSRWGSCSKKGNLNFNYRIIFLPEALANYIVVHELCHLGQFNHSKKFWELVEHTLPNWRELKRKLR